VDINSAHAAILSTVAFEAATKQNRPQLNVTQVFYARLATANKDIEPEIECVNPTTGKSAGFGELKGGLLVEGLRVHLNYLANHHYLPLIVIISVSQTHPKYAMV
jgi:exosome complex RNA-binding protein Rrp4